MKRFVISFPDRKLQCIDFYIATSFLSGFLFDFLSSFLSGIEFPIWEMGHPTTHLRLDARGQAHAHAEAARSEPRVWERRGASARPKSAQRDPRARAWGPHGVRDTPEAGATWGARLDTARHETHGRG